ncbi:MAG: hypothetical protein V1778_01040 [bacterium]
MHRPTSHISTRTFTLAILVVFLVSFSWFLFLQMKPVFPDPDSFYHIKMAQLIQRQGVVEHFPWLAFTGLTNYYTDQHLLYHVFLVPFVALFEPVFGAKLATICINAALFALLAAFLIHHRVRWWWVFILILLFTNPFLFRINLVKAPGLSLILLLVGLWLLFARRIWPLAILGFLYVWTYGGFTLLGIFGAVFVAVTLVHDWHHRSIVASVFRHFSLRRFSLSRFLADRRLFPLYAIILGLCAGLLINPYFPKNLFFYWQQLIQIGIVNFQNVVNVGGEWHPYGFVELIANTVFVSIVVLLGLVALVLARRRQSKESWTLFLLTVFLFLITLKSRRYVELYVPLATLFAAFALRDGIPGSLLSAAKRMYALMGKRVGLAILLGLYIAGAAVMVVVRDERQLIRDMQSGFRPEYLAGVGTWLRNHTPKDSVVVQSDWDEFPSLFYHDDHNRFIVGLDPTFMFQYDRALYQRWADLTSGNRTSDATQIIVNDLKSTTVVVTKDHQAFQKTMEQQPAFRVVYDDADATIYQLKKSQQLVPGTQAETFP